MPHKDPEAKKQYLANYRKKRKEAGICTGCGRRLTYNTTQCLNCRKKRQDKLVHRKESGLCSVYNCKNSPVTGRAFCQEHANKAKLYRARKIISWKAAGLCPECGRDKPKQGKKRCSHCYIGYRKRMHKIKKIVFEHYGGFKCACCGEPNRFFLTIDHIQGGGNKHRKKWKTQLVTWLYYHGLPDGYQVLCFNCNSGRARCGGVCPHKLTKTAIKSLSLTEDHTSHLRKFAAE